MTPGAAGGGGRGGGATSAIHNGATDSFHRLPKVPPPNRSECLAGMEHRGCIHVEPCTPIWDEVCWSRELPYLHAEVVGAAKLFRGRLRERARARPVGMRLRQSDGGVCVFVTAAPPLNDNTEFNYLYLYLRLVPSY